MRKINITDFYDATLFCKTFNATIAFQYTNEGSEVDVYKRHIIIDLVETNDLNWFWSLVFHEICHIVCLDEGKYRIYHEDTLSDKKMGVYIRKMGLRIERFVDRMAEDMMNEYQPDLKFEHSYLDQEGIDFFNKWVDEVYPL